MSAGIIDARFAGGAITVDTSDAAGVDVVSLAMPGDRAAMFPDEARRLAVALIEHAARAENRTEGDWP